MRRIATLALSLLIAGLLAGCGDPAPSTTLAPDQKPLDGSKMSSEQIEQMLKKDHGAGADRSAGRVPSPGGVPGAGGAAGQPGGVPAGR